MPTTHPNDRREASGSSKEPEHARVPHVRFIGETYRLLFEKNPLPMWVFDVKSLYFLAANDAALAHYGYTRNEFLRMTIKDLQPPDGMPALLKELEGLDSATESISLGRHVRRDGTIIDVEVLGNEIDFDGHRARFIMATDITDRLRAERRLRTGFAVTGVLTESPSFQEAIPRLLRAICEEAGWEYGELWRTSLDGTSLRWEGAWHMEGFPSREFEEASRAIAVRRGIGIPGTTWATGHAEWIEELTPAADFHRVRLAANLGLRQALAFPIMGRGRKVFGVMVFFSRTVREPDPMLLDLMADLGHRISGSLEHERSEQERARLEEQFSKAFYESPLPAAITRLNDGYILDVNASFVRTFGYSREEVLGHTTLELSIWASPSDRERIMAQVRNGRNTRGEEVGFRTRSGEVRRALVSVETITVAREPTILTTLVDVTDFRKLQRRLMDTERLASISETAAFVAHEINTPLTNIALVTANLARTTTDPAVREKLERIDAQRRMASRIITELLSIARFTEIAPEPVDLGALVRMAADQAASYRAPEVSLVLDLGDGPVTAAVDPLKMLQVFVNVIKNAYHATVQGSVTVSLHERDGSVTATVKDTGIGVDPKEREQLFRPFYTTKPRGEGIGLGLTFVKTVVTAHHGTVDVASEPGGGTAVTITLPTRAPPM